MLRGDIVKDDSGAYAVFTEQGSSASQMTAAKVVDVFARLPDCKEKLRMLKSYLKIPKSECPDVWIRLPKQNGRSHGIILKILLFFLKETYTDTHSQGSCGKDGSKKH